MNPDEPRTPHEDEEFSLDAASDDAGAPDVPESPADTLIIPPAGGPPRVVAETPVGGLRPAYRAPGDADETPFPAEEEAPPAGEPEPAIEDAPTALSAEEPPAVEEAEVVEAASEQPVASEEAPPAERESDEDAVVAAEPEPEIEPVAAPEARSTAESPAEVAGETATEVIAEIADAAPAPIVEVPDLEAPASVVRAAIAAAEFAPAEPEPAPAPVEETPESPASAQEWDEDLSPALAAVLFGSPRKPPAEATPTAETAVPAARPRAPQIAGPIRLTDEAEARTLPLTAGEHAAPAPDAALTGKVRYTRLEEPLKDEGGQRVVETWAYFKPDYPGLDGQLVREVRSEEERFSDGSWRWRYERQYADGGRDRREVRANADRTYFERIDEIAQRDPATGKRQQIKEEAGMIFAPPPREEKRGLLSSLLRRDDDEMTGPAAWREATPGEMRLARKEGGRAFKRGLFG
ncbi:MAG: hypothetical protein AB1716_22050 [Planctomycetota bacterium]